MKKFSLSLVSLAVCSSLYASSSMDMGLVSAKVGDGNNNGGFSLDVKGFYHPKFLKGIGIGASLGTNYFTLDKTSSLNDDAGISADIDILLGYDYKKATFFAGGGYTIGQIGSATFDGTNYQVGTEYSFSTHYGVGIKYKHNSIEFTGNLKPKTDLDITSIYLKYTN